MKWRNQLLALVCLLAFGGVGIIYFQHWVIRKPFGIILFVGEGLAAAASAIATGERVNNRAIAINGDGKPLKSIIELAREYGRATGLVTDAKLTDPTSAAFYAHTGDPNDPEKIAAEFVDRGNVDVAMGGGAEEFIPAAKGGERQDTRDLL